MLSFLGGRFVVVVVVVVVPSSTGLRVIGLPVAVLADDQPSPLDVQKFFDATFSSSF